MKKPSYNGIYVYVGGKTYDARTKKAREAIQRDGRSSPPISRWDGEAWHETGMELHSKQSESAMLGGSAAGRVPR